MLFPKRTKYRKQFKQRIKGQTVKGSKIVYGNFALKAINHGRITARQIEAARRAMTRHIKRGGKVWIRVFPDKPVSAKPVEVRMGKGKGATDRWVAVVKRGKVMFEIAGVDESIAREAFRKAHHKLPVKTKFIAREEEF